jgi:hypothetical protein
MNLLFQTLILSLFFLKDKKIYLNFTASEKGFGNIKDPQK